MPRYLEQYWTDKLSVAELVKAVHIPEWSVVLEPCAGTKNIVTYMKDYDVQAKFYTNDIDPEMPTQLHKDATKRSFWEQFIGAVEQPDWVITNPPFSQAPDIAEFSIHYAVEGVALLLPINFMEGVQDRTFLVNHPPNGLVVLPRYSFSQDGRMDTKTCAWFIWDHELRNQPIRIVSKFKYSPKVLD